jgi:spore germination protein
MKIFWGFLLFIILALGSGYLYLTQTFPQTDPLLAGKYYIEKIMNPRPKFDKHVLGFMPYWRTDDIPLLKPQLLSEINYFSLTAGYDGHLEKVVDGETNPGWRGWQTQEVKDLITKSRIMDTDFTVTIAALNNDRIESILDSKEAQTTLINEIIELVKTDTLSGVNIDFEYFGEPDPSYRPIFTKFSKTLSAKLKKEVPNSHLSLSIMPLAAREKDLYEFDKLSPIYDRFLGMSYDFYGEHSVIAGPISPMHGFKDNKFFFDVETMYKDYVKVLPKEKIIMGVPYYGWDWAVEDGKTINSLTYPADHVDNYAAVISYARGREEKLLNPKQCTWDQYAEETWCWYTHDGIDHQVWLADNKSVAARFDFASKQKLGGIGIWVLGYDKDYPDLWNMIKDTFSK